MLKNIQFESFIYRFMNHSSKNTYNKYTFVDDDVIKG